MIISKETARRFLVRYHHLDGSLPLFGMDGVMEYVKKVGCIQYDPLNIVGRNADLVLQSRVSDYDSVMLERLLYEKRSLIDGWDKVMSIYATEDWQFFHLVREQRGKEAIGTLQYRNQSDAVDYIDVVISALKQHGALQPKQIGSGFAGSGTWGHRNIYGAAMDYLFHAGRLGVSKKLNVNKVYDLIENLLPSHILNNPPPFETEHDFGKLYVYRRIGGLGMLWNRNGGGWLGTLMPDKKARKHILDAFVDEGIVTEIEVEGIADKFYARSKDVCFETMDQPASTDVKIIAPLDNLIWDRDMAARVFNFEYTWEVYIPAAKRKYGYYVLPVLCGDRFIARFEPEKSPTHMCVKNWWWEKDVDVTDELIESVLQSLERFADFLNKPQGVDKTVRKKLTAKPPKNKSGLGAKKG